VGHTTVTPLRVEEMLDLAERAIRIVVRETDRDESRIPAPLMWIEAWCGLRPCADAIPGQNGECLVA
jgi:hypothetical protein